MDAEEGKQPFFEGHLGRHRSKSATLAIVLAKIGASIGLVALTLFLFGGIISIFKLTPGKGGGHLILLVGILLLPSIIAIWMKNKTIKDRLFAVIAGMVSGALCVIIYLIPLLLFERGMLSFSVASYISITFAVLAATAPSVVTWMDLRRSREP